jgi:hypothetical protein
MPKKEILDHNLDNFQMETYQEFHSAADAKPLISILKSNGVVHEVEVPKQIMDNVMGGNPLSPTVFIKLRLEDFKRVNKLVEDDMLRLIQDGKVDLKAHFLQEAPDEELIDVLRKPDEWSIDTVVIARHLLHLRGVELSQEHIEALQQERLKMTQEPKKGSDGWILALFLLSSGGWVFVSFSLAAYLATFATCLGMGYYFWKDITTGPNGERYLTFDQTTRNRGRIIMILTLISNALFWMWFLVVF